VKKEKEKNQRGGGFREKPELERAGGREKFKGVEKKTRRLTHQRVSEGSTKKHLHGVGKTGREESEKGKEKRSAKGRGRTEKKRGETN